MPEIPDIDDLGIFVYLKINENLKKLTFTNIRQIIEKIENETNFTAETILNDTIY